MYVPTPRKNSQATVFMILGVVLVIVVFLFFYLNKSDSTPQTLVDTRPVFSSVNGCIEKAAQKVFAGFGDSGLPSGTTPYPLPSNTANVLPLYTTIPTVADINSKFSLSTTVDATICIKKIDFSALGWKMLTDPTTIAVTLQADASTNKMKATLITPIQFESTTGKQVTLPAGLIKNYPLDFTAYVDRMTEIKAYIDSNPTTSLNCEQYLGKINGKSTIDISKLDSTHALIKILDYKVIEDNYISAYVWRAVVNTASNLPESSCIQSV